MNKDLYQAIIDRRSFYELGKEKILSDEELAKLVRHAVKYAPSAFNSQSARVLLLLGNEHDKLWTYTKDILREIVPADRFSPTEAKLDAFRGGYGTVLYFEDQTIVKSLQEKFPLYQENFPVWSLQSSGMLQYIVWTTLVSEGYGASLQHYNPLIDEKVKKAWNIPDDWKLLSQMPFGKPLANPDQKTFLPLEDRIKIFK